MALCGPELISRVLGNLVDNAIKFTSPSGSVIVNLANLGDCVRVGVTDDGPGIPAEHHERIFEKFGQLDHPRKHLGTGLGLTFCKLAVESHGGTIGVLDNPGGRSSTFWFALPRR